MFDYVIGNSPYNKGLVNKSHSMYNLIGKVKLAYYAFIFKAIDELKDNGECIFIIPSTFLTSESGKEVRNYIMLNGSIKFLKILEHNPFNGYHISGSVIILKFVKGIKCNTVFERTLGNRSYSYETNLRTIIPLYFNSISASILDKVMNKAKLNPVEVIRNRPRHVFEKNKINKYKTLVRINKGNDLIFKYVPEQIDSHSEKLVFSLMMNMETLYKDKMIHSVFIKDTDADKGMIYIKCKNFKNVQNYLKSKILYICLLQMLDGAHLTKYNLGKIVPDIDDSNLNLYFSLTNEEIEFIENF